MSCFGQCAFNPTSRLRPYLSQRQGHIEMHKAILRLRPDQSQRHGQIEMHKEVFATPWP